METPMDNAADPIDLKNRPAGSSHERTGELVAVWLGLAVGWRRVLRRGPVLAVVLGAALAVVGALIERRLTIAGATDRALSGTFRLVIPLVTFAVVAEVTDRSRLRDAVWSIARYGVSRRATALGVIAAAVFASMAASALLSFLSVVTSYSAAAPPLVLDAVQSVWIGALVAAAYAGWFCLGATFFARGGGRWVPLVADFLWGGTTGFAAAVLPHAHARNLLGGAGPSGLSQRGSSAMLLVMAILLCLAAAGRSRE
jgi:hypothetical protein